jgi:hypothetical protein
MRGEPQLSDFMLTIYNDFTLFLAFLHTISVVLRFSCKTQLSKNRDICFPTFFSNYRTTDAQWSAIAALFVHITITGGFRNKSNDDGRIRCPIQ